jgi:peptide/nickel transport system substrate-binding protein
MRKGPISRAISVIALAAAGLLTACRHDNPVTGGAAGTARGGQLVAALRSEPKSYNRFVSARAAEELLSLLTQATLVRTNRATGALEPRLARDWTISPDGLTWTIRLRDDATFSDGVPFTAADVVFSFQALYDERAATELASSVMVDGRPLAVRGVDDHTVVFELPAVYGPGIALLDSVPILPRHKLEGALAQGTFRDAWNMTTPPADIVGLGPFVVESYAPGQKLVLARNSRFWGRDAEGTPLPYLDRLELRFVSDQNAEVLRMTAGDIDLMNGGVRPEDLVALKPLADRHALALVDAGVGVNSSALWINLTPSAKVARDRPWLQKGELRQAISYAIDRRAIVDQVYLGAGEPIWGPVTPGHGEWYVPDLPKTELDRARARTILAGIGLIDRTGDGLVDDAVGRTARFSILTQKGNTAREKTCAIVLEQLRQVGLAVDVVALDIGSILQHYDARDYDAIYFGAETNAPDPARNLDFWLSSGSFHYWNAQQTTPATTWEAKIDDLMRQQSATVDQAARRRLFAEAQRILAAELPTLHFAVPKVTIAISSRVTGALPSVLQPPVLWNAETLSIVMPPGSATRR